MARSFLFVALLATLAITASANQNPGDNKSPSGQTFGLLNKYTLGGLTWQWKAGWWCTVIDPVTGVCTGWGGNNWGFWWPVRPSALPVMTGPAVESGTAVGADGIVYQLCTATTKNYAVAGGCDCGGTEAVLISKPIAVVNSALGPQTYDCGSQSGLVNPVPPGAIANCNAWICQCSTVAGIPTVQAWAYCV